MIEEALVDVEAARAVDEDAETALEQSAEEAVIEAVRLAGRFEAERDEYLDMLRRLQAEFENYKRRVDAQREEQRAQAAADLVRELLPVLDACEAAVGAGHADVEPVRVQLLGTLEKHGLVPVSEPGVGFDPNIHEAVLHEEGDGEPVVAEVMRTGYLWNDRVVRAAMVKVRG
jgi:molecular chaperone GrpE